jgi:hypothetical protein
MMADLGERFVREDGNRAAVAPTEQSFTPFRYPPPCRLAIGPGRV